MRGKSSGIGFQITPVDGGRLAVPAPPVAVGLHHEPVVLHPLDEAVGAACRSACAPAPWRPSSVAKRAGRICAPIWAMRTGIRGSGFLVTIADRGRARPPARPRSSRSPTCTTVLPRIEVALDRRLDVLGGERRAVVELHARPQRELPRGVVHALPGGGQARLQLERGVPAGERVVEVVEVVDGEDLRAAAGVHGGRVGRRGEHELRPALGGGRRAGGDGRERPATARKRRRVQGVVIASVSLCAGRARRAARRPPG